MLKMLKKFLEKKKSEKKAKEIYYRIEDLDEQERKKIEEMAKMQEIARLMREVTLLRKEQEKLKDYIRSLEGRLIKVFEKEEREAIEVYKRTKKLRETKIFFYSKPPISVIPFDTKTPFLALDGTPCRFMTGIKLIHDTSGEEPIAYPLISNAPIDKVKVPKDVYRLILSDSVARLSRVAEIIKEPDILVYSIKYGVPISVEVGEFTIEKTRSENSHRVFFISEKPIKIRNGEEVFVSKSGEKLQYLVGVEICDSRYKEPLVYPLLSSSKVSFRGKPKVYSLETKQMNIYLSDMFSLFLEREKILKCIKGGKPLKLSVTQTGIFVKDYIEG